MPRLDGVTDRQDGVARMFACRILPHEAADGPANMALDEVLLASVAADPTRAALRTYSWTEPTLSLGYFQSLSLAEAEPRWRGVPIVRRPTGGGALWHHREITYAVVIPKTHPLARRSTDLYRAVHAAIAGLLATIGLTAGRRGEVDGGSPELPKPFLCFADRDPEDVVSGSVKIVGSAQRRRAGAVLQHGSILLARSPVTPELAGASDLVASTVDPFLWSSWLLKAIPQALAFERREDSFSTEERALAAELATGVYRDPAWTGKR
jgi:lipoate-protein ligase A